MADKIREMFDTPKPRDPKQTDGLSHDDDDKKVLESNNTPKEQSDTKGKKRIKKQTRSDSFFADVRKRALTIEKPHNSSHWSETTQKNYAFGKAFAEQCGLPSFDDE